MSNLDDAIQEAKEVREMLNRSEFAPDLVTVVKCSMCQDIVPENEATELPYPDGQDGYMWVCIKCIEYAQEIGSTPDKALNA